MDVKAASRAASAGDDKGDSCIGEGDRLRSILPSSRKQAYERVIQRESLGGRTHARSSAEGAARGVRSYSSREYVSKYD